MKKYLEKLELEIVFKILTIYHKILLTVIFQTK